MSSNFGLYKNVDILNIICETEFQENIYLYKYFLISQAINSIKTASSDLLSVGSVFPVSLNHITSKPEN